MTSFETQVQDALQSAAGEFVDLFARAQELTLPNIAHLTDGARTVMAPLMMRAGLIKALDGRSNLDSEGWSVSVDELHMMSITFTCEPIGAKFKVLKERAGYPGRVPTARRGTNRASYWQPTLFDGSLSKQLLFLFDIDDVRKMSDWELNLRAVRPTTSSPYGTLVPCDLSIPIVADAGFYENNPFPTAEDEDFFADIRREENES